MNKKILIYENDEYFKGALEEVLKEYMPNTTIETVVDRKEAFNRLISYEYDLCVIAKEEGEGLLWDSCKLELKTPFIIFQEDNLKEKECGGFPENLRASISKPYLNKLLLAVCSVFSH